jgi:hypothetical protein
MLLTNQALYFSDIDAVAKLEQEVTMPAVQSVSNLFHPPVMARFAVRS